MDTSGVTGMVDCGIEARARQLAAPTVVAWSAFYALLGIYWTAGGAGFPFGRNDVAGPASGSLLSGLDPNVGGPAIVTIASGGALIATAMWRRHTGRARPAIIAGGCTVVAGLLCVAMDARSITLLPPLGLVGWTAIDDWPTLNQLLLGFGALAWIAATAVYMGATRPTAPEARQRRIRIGSGATVVAILCPLPYAVIRVSWAIGRPIGAPKSFVEMLARNQPGVAAMEAVLAGFACAGSLLTAGLMMHWGRIFPTWVPRLGGRPVPRWFPLAFGTSAAVAIFPFGRGAWNDALGLHVDGAPDELQTWGLDIDRPAFWGVDGLGWLFPLWAIALGIALVGYHHRRRAHDGFPENKVAVVSSPSAVRQTLGLAILAAAAAMAALPAAGDTEGWIHTQSPELPAPTGAAPVGVRGVHLVDAARTDPRVPDKPHRELMVTVHYPADRDNGSLEDLALAPYTSEQVALHWGRSMGATMGIRPDAVNWQFRTHAREHAPVAPGRHPVVIYTPPPGKPRFAATSLAQDLASHGYIVVAVDHTHESPVVEFPGRRLEEGGLDWQAASVATRSELLSMRADDIEFVATHLDALGDELAGAVDVDRIAALGHVSPLREAAPLRLLVPLDVTYGDAGLYRPSADALEREAHVRRSVRASLAAGLRG
jgi:hypothetical protein